jgi:hypothetical protein
MKFMKSIMGNMMPLMMKGTTKEEKEDLMLKMMPMMMEDIDLAELLPKLMTAMLPAMLPELMASLLEDGVREKLLKLFASVMPNACEVIDKPKLAQKKDALLAELMSHDTFREKMPKCFTAGFPIMFKGFVDHFYPVISQEERNAFIVRMIENLIQSLPPNDKAKLLGTFAK